MRIEKDSLGEKEVPEEAFYGIQSSRSKENFNAAGERLPLEIAVAPGGEPPDAVDVDDRSAMEAHEAVGVETLIE